MPDRILPGMDMTEQKIKEPSMTAETEPSGADIQLFHTSDITVGIFSDYDDETEEALRKSASDFDEYSIEELSGYRDKFSLSIDLADGTTKKFMVKSKFPKMFGVTAKESMEMHRDELKEAASFDASMEEHGLRPGIDTPLTSKLMVQGVQDQIKTESVLNEVLVARKASFRYKQKFGEELPIEKAVGFVVKKDGQKWVIFEFVDNIVDVNTLTEEERKTLQENGTKFAKIIEQQLKSVGIITQDLVKAGVGKNLVFTKDEKDQLNPMLIDIEEWRMS